MEEKNSFDAPNCYACIFRQDVPGDAHSACRKRDASVTGYSHGIKHGWFIWPFNFDPTWLTSCNSFQIKNDDQSNKKSNI